MMDFAMSEYRDRLEAVRRRMADEGLDALIDSPPPREA